jgi:aldehyde:ferredoxin oxidoreductase
MPYGYTGNILRVNLNSHKFTIENPDESFYRTYWGGRALALYYLLKEQKPGIEPLSAESMLIFASSPIVGTTAPAINRFTVCAKSPLTSAQGEAEAGGYWGPELKKAGFDAIVIQGISKEPVYLWIKDGKVEIKKADHLWGKESGVAQKMIQDELEDSRIRVALIGPGGEKLVRFANITNNLEHFNGRNGMGAVMGSKKLKAIAVRGTRELRIFNKEKVREMAKLVIQRSKEHPLAVSLREKGTMGAVSAINEGGWLPTRNWSSSGFKKGDNLTAEVMNKTLLKKNNTCFACPIACKRVVEYSDTDMQIDSQYGGPEYEAVGSFGSLCGVDDLKYVSKANEWCNRYTIDVISTGASIAFAMQCFEEGLINEEDTGGIKLEFGNKEAMLKMVENICKRQGFGDILADGTFIASKKIGKESEKFLHVVKKQELPMHDPRVKVGVGLQYAFADYGADHMKAVHDNVFLNKETWGTQELSGLGIFEPISTTVLNEEKVRIFKLTDIQWSLYDTLGMCVFGWVARGIGKMEELLETIRAITGWRTTWFELMKLGERSINMAHFFNIREGFTPEDDYIPEVFYHPFPDGPLEGTGAINKKEFEKAKELRYDLMGWDPKTGRPRRGTLTDLKLGWLIEES